ncbi:hypothetical protein EVAR_39476_1 [Eumeta japonica]|uniref:Uncharacterized protein n=1 Tax=Eumeta variegata TaxID=151549 RepID=A0A4C1VZJ8_EUMVA|nr:hypothetical protein EVAR_39476_1 [Eumeta japonica]
MILHQLYIIATGTQCVSYLSIVAISCRAAILVACKCQPSAHQLRDGDARATATTHAADTIKFRTIYRSCRVARDLKQTRTSPGFIPINVSRGLRPAVTRYDLIGPEERTPCT